MGLGYYSNGVTDTDLKQSYTSGNTINIWPGVTKTDYCVALILFYLE